MQITKQKQTARQADRPINRQIERQTYWRFDRITLTQFHAHFYGHGFHVLNNIAIVLNSHTFNLAEWGALWWNILHKISSNWEVFAGQTLWNPSIWLFPTALAGHEYIEDRWQISSSCAHRTTWLSLPVFQSQVLHCPDLFESLLMVFLQLWPWIVSRRHCDEDD